jgi:cytoskeletal protein CcmA (bactofilin family)
LSKVFNEPKRPEQLRRATISAGVCIKGEVSCNEDLTVDGSVEGPVHLGEGALTIGAGAALVGNVEALEVLVLGSIRGNLKVRGRITIKAEGSVVGDVSAARIIIEDGAFFYGAMEINRT